MPYFLFSRRGIVFSSTTSRSSSESMFDVMPGTFLAQICRIHMPLKDKFKTFYSCITGNNSFRHYTCTCIWFLVNLLLSVVYWLKHWMFKCLLIKDLIVTELDGFFLFLINLNSVRIPVFILYWMRKHCRFKYLDL